MRLALATWKSCSTPLIGSSLSVTQYARLFAFGVLPRKSEISGVDSADNKENAQLAEGVVCETEDVGDDVLPLVRPEHSCQEVLVRLGLCVGERMQ